MFTDFNIAIAVAGLVFAGMSAGIGYYIGERGTAGVKIDLDNTKMEIERLKNLVAKKTDTKATTVAAPVTGAKATDTITRTITSS